MTGEPLLDVRDLKVSFRTEDGLVRAVDGVSLSLARGETLGIVGESGSGKSVTMMSVMRLISDPNARFEGEVLFKGHDLMTLNPEQMREIRGGGIAMIFQDPMTSLNPVYRVGWQIAEQIRAHENVSKQAARARAIELLFERLAVSWTISDIATTRQKELLARYRMATAGEREFVLASLRTYLAENFPELEAP